MKTCNTCGVCKPLSEFHRRANRPSGVVPRCKDCKAKWVAEYRASNLEVVRARSLEWHRANKTRSIANTRAWQKANPGWGTANTKMYEMAKRQAVPPWADRDAIARIYREARRKSKETGTLWHVDHEVPLRAKLVCGLHVESNLRVIPWLENVLKSNHWEVQ